MHRILSRIIVTILTLIVLTGCGREFTLNVAQFTASLSTLDMQYDQVAETVGSYADQFSDDEQARLATANRQFKQLRQAAQALIADSGGVTQAVIKIDQVRMLYGHARSSYASVRDVICPDTIRGAVITPESCARLASMQTYEQQMLLNFDRHAMRTRDALEGILNSPAGTDVTQAISDVLTIGATAARIARLGTL